MSRKISLLGLFSALALLAVLVLIPMRANAATTFKTYNNGTVVSLKRAGKLYYQYTLAEDSLVEINFSNNYSFQTNIVIYSDKEMTQTVYYVNETHEYTNAKVFVPLVKGTYYIDMCEGDMYYAGTNEAKAKLTATPVSSINKNNYTRNKAIQLASNKWAKIVQTPDNEYCRWYKITVPKTQKVTFDIASGEYYFINLINIKNGKYYNMEHNGRTITTQNRVSAGTYYVYVHQYPILSLYEPSYFAGNPYVGVYYQFMWY